MTWKCNFDGISTYALSSTRSGKVNMLPTMTTADQYMISGLAAVVGITFDTTLNYNLMDTITIEVNEIQTGKFNYRINDIWLTTDPTANQPYTSIDTSQYKRTKVMENGCQKLPILSNNGLKVEFYAVGFADLALPQTLYLRASVLACPLSATCPKSGCTSVIGSWVAPSRRRRHTQMNTHTSGTSFNFNATSTYIFQPEDGDAIMVPLQL